MGLLDFVTKGSTDRSVIIRVINLDGTPASPAYNSPGIDLWYRREGAAKTSITEASLSALTDAHADGGFLLIDDGDCRLDLPDAAFASGANYVDVGGAIDDMIVIGGRVRLVDYSLEDAVRMGMTALPNAAASAAGGVFTRGTGAGQINQDANGRLDVNIVAWRGTQPNTLTSGRVEVLVGAMTNGVIAAATFAANALDAVWSTATRTLTAISDSSGITTLLSRLSSARAGYLDNLNVGGNVASSAEVTAIQNNTRCVIVVPDVIERPDSETFATMEYRVELMLYDMVGNMEAPDSAPTIALVNQAGTDRSSRLDSTTMASVSTGRYRAVYTASSADELEQLVWVFSIVEGGATRVVGRQSLIVDTTAVDFTAADRTKLDTLHDSRLTSGRAAALDLLDAAISTRATPAQVAAELATYDGPTNAEMVARTLAAASYATASALATVGSAVDGIKQTTDKVDDTLEEDAGTWRYTANALEQAPSGTGASAASIRAEMDANSTQFAAIRGKTDNLPTDPADQSQVIAATDAILTLVGTRATPAQVNAEVVDALTIDTYAEPTAPPAATASVVAKVGWVAALARNKQTANDTTAALRNDGDTANIATASLSDEDGTTTRGKWTAA